MGTPIEYMLREVTRMVVELAGGESELVYEPLPKGGQPKSLPPRRSRLRQPGEVTCTWRPPPQPVSPYGVSKLAAERYMHYYHVQYGLAYAALRQRLRP